LPALHTLGDAPARSLTALAQRLGVSEADAATVVVPLAEEPAPLATVPAAAPASPLLPMTGPHGVSSAPKTRLNRRRVIAARKRTTRWKNVLLINAPLTILFLSDTYGGRIHEKRIAEAPPYPLPAESRLLQDLGSLAFTLPQVEILMPTKKPRGQELTLAQHVANQALTHRRLRIEHVHSRVKRCRIVKDRGAWGRRASAIWWWQSAVHCITSRFVLPLGNRWFNQDKLMSNEVRVLEHLCPPVPRYLCLTKRPLGWKKSWSDYCYSIVNI
jgi:hypothetical protein